MVEKLGVTTIGGLIVVVLLGALVAGPAMGQTNEPPTASVQARPTTARAGALVLFDAMGSSDVDGSITSYSWNFGDGTPDVSGPPAEATQVYHSFSEDGVYDVTLTVTDDQGDGNDPADPSAVVTVTIGSGPPGVDGAALFEERCVSCHTKLNVAGRGLSVADLVDVMTTGLMRNKNSPLSDDEIEAIAFYIALDEAISDEPPAPGFTIPEDANAARLHFLTCTGCHGASGEGGIGPSLQVLTLTKREMSAIVADGIGTMPGLAGTLTEGQIATVSKYVVQLQSPTATTTTTTVPTTTNGSKLYQSECALCHGSYGNGNIGPPVQTSTMSESETVTIISQGAALMPAYAGLLTQEQIANVAAYSVGFQTGESTGAIVPDSDGGGVENELGGEVYNTTCAACHGAAGEGAMGPSLQASTFDLSATSDAVANGVGAMPGFASGLTPEELDAVSAYSVAFQGGTAADTTGGGVSTSDAPVAIATGEGADLFASNCAVCHGATGEGASAAPINVPFENEQLVEIIRVGIADMPGFASSLNDGQVTVLANFVHALAAQAAPTTTVAVSSVENIVAIQPSRYVEFDTSRSSVPLDQNVLLVLALGSLTLLGVLAYWQARQVHRSGRTPTSDQVTLGPLPRKPQ